MKNTVSILIILFLIVASIKGATTIKGQFIVLENNGTIYVVMLQINTNTVLDDMGSATIIFNFNHVDLSIPISSGVLVSPSTYVYHNFSDGSYSTATITNPSPNQLWLNIELNSDGNGTLIAQSPDWTDLVTITFTTLDSNGNSNLEWQTADSNWRIYDGNNETFWVTGTFTNLNNHPLPVELEIEMVPEKFNLYQNYPNPFNPETTIKFALPRNTMVSLIVYNLIGEKVATILDENKEAGYYNMLFNANNLSSGVYIYRLTAENFIQTKIMTLIR